MAKGHQATKEISTRLASEHANRLRNKLALGLATPAVVIAKRLAAR